MREARARKSTLFARACAYYTASQCLGESSREPCRYAEYCAVTVARKPEVRARRTPCLRHRFEASYLHSSFFAHTCRAVSPSLFKAEDLTVGARCGYSGYRERRRQGTTAWLNCIAADAKIELAPQHYVVVRPGDCTGQLAKESWLAWQQDPGIAPSFIQHASVSQVHLDFPWGVESVWRNMVRPWCSCSAQQGREARAHATRMAKIANKMQSMQSSSLHKPDPTPKGQRTQKDRQRFRRVTLTEAPKPARSQTSSSSQGRPGSSHVRHTPFSGVTERFPKQLRQEPKHCDQSRPRPVRRALWLGSEVVVRSLLVRSFV